MRVFAMLTLSTSILLATASTQAHTRTPVPKNLATPLTFDREVAMTPAGGTRPSFSSRASSSFHSSSTPSYHSYSSTPSRSFSFRSSSPSISTRPATTSAPRTYTYRISGVPRTKTYTPAPSSLPAEVHHYQSSGGGGMSTMDYLVLNQVMNGHNRDSDNGGTSTAKFTSSEREAVGPGDSSEDRMPTWLIISFVVVGVLCFGGLIYGLVVYLDLES